MKKIFFVILLFVLTLTKVFAQKIIVDVTNHHDTATITINVNYGDSIIIRWIDNDSIPFCFENIFIVFENFFPPDSVLNFKYINQAHVNAPFDTIIITGQKNFFVSGACGFTNKLINLNYITYIKSNLKEEKIFIFPNPLTSSSTLQLNTQLKDVEVVIYNILGKEMMRKKLTGDRMEIERGSLESGVYFVRVRSEERQWVEKVVVE